MIPNPDADVIQAHLEHLWEDTDPRYDIDMAGLSSQDMMLLGMALENQAAKMYEDGHPELASRCLDLREDVFRDTPDLWERIQEVAAAAEESDEFGRPTYSPRTTRILTAAALALLWASGYAVGSL